MISFLPVNICHFNKMLFNKKTYHFYFISIVLFYCLHYFGWKCQQQLSALMFTSSKSVTLRWFQKPLVTSAMLHFHISHPLPEFYGSLFPPQDIFLKVIATSHNLKNKIQFFYTITFWFHGRNEMLTEKEQLAFIRDYTRTFTVHLGWIRASVLLVQHQFKRCFAEVKNCGTTLFLWMF